MYKNILAIDDEPDLLRLLERIIREKTPFTVTAVGNSLEVPEILKDNEFDVIITDLKMPGLDGLDILKLIKSSNRPEQVIIITAFGSLESAMEALSNDVFDYITKPFKKEQIIFTVDKAIKYQKAMKFNNKMLKLFEATPIEAAVELFKQEYMNRGL
jgi:DNA-binding NtrC family response regulator